jgi:hypothetical protein
MRIFAKLAIVSVAAAVLAASAIVMWGRDPSPRDLPPMEGRVHDRIGAWIPFCWLPDLR